MGKDLVVPKIHIEGQLIIDAIDIESRHVADNTLKRTVNLQLGKEQIGEDTTGFAGLAVSVMPGLAFNAGDPAALVRVRVGEYEAGIEANLRVEPAIPVGREFEMILLKEDDAANKVFGGLCGGVQRVFPVVKRAARDVHD